MWCPTCQNDLQLSAVGPWGLVCAHCQTELDATSNASVSDSPPPSTDQIPVSSFRGQPDGVPVSSQRLRRDPAHSVTSFRPHSVLESVGTPESSVPASSHPAGEFMPPALGDWGPDLIAKPGWWQSLLPPAAAICLFVCGQLLHLVAFAQQQRQSLTLATVMSVAAVCIALLYGRRSSEASPAETAPHAHHKAVSHPAAPAAPSWRKRQSMAASNR